MNLKNKIIEKFADAYEVDALESYLSIIENAVCDNRKKNCGEYYEKHHILPKCCGGDDEKDNLVLLTAKEHFLCHYYLCCMYKGSKKYSKMLYALNSMITWENGNRNLTEDIIPNSEKYEELRIDFSNIHSMRMKKYRNNFPDSPAKGCKWNKNSRKKRSDLIKERGIPDNFTMLGRKHTVETKNKISNANKGKRFSSEHRKNISKNHARLSGFNHPGYVEFNEEKIILLKELIRENKTQKEILSIMGIGMVVLKNRCKELGISLPDGRKMGRTKWNRMEK